MGAHNLIRDGFATTLGPLLTTAGYLLPSSTFDIEPQLHLPSDPHARPFDLSFNPDPSSPPLINHACPYTTVDFDVTITSPPPYPSFNPTSPNVTTILMAYADTHLQKYEKKRVGRDNKTNPTTGTISVGDTIIGELLTRNMVLILWQSTPMDDFAPSSKLSSLTQNRQHLYHSRQINPTPLLCTPKPQPSQVLKAS